jgi:hypothetical protein
MVVSFNGAMNGSLLDGIYRLDYDIDPAGPSRGSSQGVMLVRQYGILGSDPDGGVFMGHCIWDRMGRCFVVSGRFIVPPHGVLITDHEGGEDGLEVKVEATGCGSRFVADIGGCRVEVAVSYIGPLPPELCEPAR